MFHWGPGPSRVPQHRAPLHTLGAKSQILKASEKKGNFPKVWRGDGVCAWARCIVAEASHPAQPWASPQWEPWLAGPSSLVGVCWLKSSLSVRGGHHCFLQLIICLLILPPRSCIACGMGGAAPRCCFALFLAPPSLHPAMAAVARNSKAAEEGRDVPSLPPVSSTCPKIHHYVLKLVARWQTKLWQHLLGKAWLGALNKVSHIDSFIFIGSDFVGCFEAVVLQRLMQNERETQMTWKVLNEWWMKPGCVQLVEVLCRTHFGSSVGT